jgi:hypothetical protein
MLKNDIIKALILEKTMGTYGVTHIKKAEQIIPLSDSYDGYFSGGMGQANLYTIKHMSDSLLARLFANFTAHHVQDDSDDDYDDDERTLTTREIEEAIFNFSHESDVSEEAKVWFVQNLESDIRTSSNGVGPLLYLNFYNHYGRDYDYCNYLLDLDSNIYYIQGCPVSFESIRKLSVAQIDLLSRYMHEEEREKLGFKTWISDLIEDYNSLNDSNENQDNADILKQLQDIEQQAHDFFNHLLTVDDHIIEERFAQEKAQRQAYIDKMKAENPALYAEVNGNKDGNENTTKPAQVFPFPDQDFEEEDDVRSYSVRTARDLTAMQMRKVLALCNKLQALAPEAHVLLKNAMWGMEEDFQTGGISFYSPRSRNQAQQDCYEAVMNVLESEFKIGFNIMSTAGSSYKYAHELKDDAQKEDEFGGIFGTPVIEPCSYSLTQIQNDNAELVDYMHPWLAYHAQWSELRTRLSQPAQEMDSPLVWLYMSLLYQDQEVFDAVLPKAMAQLNSVEETHQKKVVATILSSVADGVHVQSLVNSLVDISAVARPVLAEDFIAHLKEHAFFAPFEAYMNNSEKAKYLDNTGGKKSKP